MEAESGDFAIRTTHDPDEAYGREQLEMLPYTDVKNVRRSGTIFGAQAMLDR